MKRRDFLTRSAAAMAGLGLMPLACATREDAADAPDDASSTAAGPLFEISLAEWSLHRALYDGEITNLEFPVMAREAFGITAVEYVNSFMREEAEDAMYVTELKNICDGEGIRSLLIMCDGLGRLGDPDEASRIEAVENHYMWVDIASFLGCHSIRVNAASEGDWDTQAGLAADGLRRLTEYGANSEINVIVENHGGLSSNGAWLSGVIERVDHERCGTLPDFGNFNLGDGETYDKYKGVEELMPYAKAVSAKSHVFDEAGNERAIDYERMMRIVLDAGYRGHVGIEYEGSEVPEVEGIHLTLELLKRVRESLAPDYT